jgi:hypothetical protein
MPPGITTAKLLRQLPPDPTPEDVRPVAREIARAASLRDCPGKSIEQACRSAVKEKCPLPVVAILRSQASEELDIIRTNGAFEYAPTPVGEWLSVEQTAAMLRKMPRTIREWLETVEGRRRLGWPWFDGREWQIPEPAINPDSRAEYMGRQPAEEPGAHRASLPFGVRGEAA